MWYSSCMTEDIQLSRPDRFALLAFTYILLLYVGSGSARDLQLWLMETLGDWYRWLPALGCTLLLIFILGRGVQSLRASTLLTRSFLLLLMSCYVGVLYLLKIPAEKFHLVQYGILAWLVTEALNGRLVGWRLHLASLLIVTAAGAGDELVQWIRPNRVGDIRDIGLNTVSAFLAQGLLCIVERVPRYK